MIVNKTRILIASIFGNALEFYNLTLYGFFVSIIAETFFPSNTPLVSTISSLMGYAIGFVVRPLGAILFGHIGDTFGRRKALGISILIMGLPAFIIGLLPGYQTLGLLAPIVLILCRIIQGLCSGGEFNGATIFALEHLGKKNPGFAGGLIVGSCLLGSLAALGIATLINLLDLPVWGWRFAFLLGGCSSFYGIYMRKKMEESPVFALLKKEDTLAQKPLKTALSKHLGSCLRVFSIGAFDGAITYTLVTFLVVYMTTNLHICPKEALQYNFFGILACMIGCPLSGYIADQWGVRRTLLWATVAVFIFIFPTLALIHTATPCSLITANIMLGFLAGGIIGAQPLFSQKLFPANTRYTGISFSYSLSIGMVGGLTPLLLTYLVSHGYSLAPAFYLMTFSFIFFFVVLKTTIKDA